VAHSEALSQSDFSPWSHSFFLFQFSPANYKDFSHVTFLFLEKYLSPPLCGRCVLWSLPAQNFFLPFTLCNFRSQAALSSAATPRAAKSHQTSLKNCFLQCENLINARYATVCNVICTSPSSLHLLNNPPNSWTGDDD